MVNVAATKWAMTSKKNMHANPEAVMEKKWKICETHFRPPPHHNQTREGSEDGCESAVIIVIRIFPALL